MGFGTLFTVNEDRRNDTFPKMVYKNSARDVVETERLVTLAGSLTSCMKAVGR